MKNKGFLACGDGGSRTHVHVRVLNESTQCRIFLVDRGFVARRVHIYFRRTNLEIYKTFANRSSMVLVGT